MCMSVTPISQAYSFERALELYRQGLPLPWDLSPHQMRQLEETVRDEEEEARRQVHYLSWPTIHRGLSPGHRKNERLSAIRALVVG